MVKDCNGIELHIGDLVAVRPGSGWYGKWRIAVIEEMTESKFSARIDEGTCKIRYKEPTLKLLTGSRTGVLPQYRTEQTTFEKSYSRTEKSSLDLAVIDPSFLED